MTHLKLTRDAGCLRIVAGGILERRIEDRARDLALCRGATAIEPEDVRKAITEVVHQEWSDLPQLIEQEVDACAERSKSAA